MGKFHTHDFSSQVITKNILISNKSLFVNHTEIQFH